MPVKPPRPNTATVQDTAAALGVTTKRVYQMVDEGKLTAITWPRHVLILRTSLDALVAERRAAP